MIELIESGWGDVFAVRAKERYPTLNIVCPFIKQRAVKSLFERGHDPEIKVITRFSLSDFYSGVSDVAALRWLLDRGASIRGVRGLHSKMYLFGENYSIVTSANLTEAALYRNQEFGFASDDSDVAVGCRSYFDGLWASAGEDLTYGRIREWEERLIEAARSMSKPPKIPDLPDQGAIVSTAEPAPFDVQSGGEVQGGWKIGAVPSASIYSEPNQAFIKFLGTGVTRKDWPITTTVEYSIKDSDCHRVVAFPKGKVPRIVGDGDVIFIALMIDDGDMIIYGRAIAIKHVPGVDVATAADIDHLPWMETWPNFVRIHDAEYVEGDMKNGVRMSEMIKELGTDSFATTQQRTAEGEIGVNPYRTYGQQAAVRLSVESTNWLNFHLEQAIEQHGRFPQEKLVQMRWA